MAYLTAKQISKARAIDLFTYLQNNEPDELVYEYKETYHTKTHDSLKINNGMWYWFSKGIGGNSALDYLIKVKNYDFKDAVNHLLNQKEIKNNGSKKQNMTEKERIDRLVLPDKAPNNDKAISYLRSRGISKEIIEECIDKGFIYQDYPNNNVVFVGYDEKNNPRYAGIRGTNTSRFMLDAYGSDKAYSFNLLSTIPNKSLHLFESAIDLLSYATIKELNNEQWDEENLLSLAGIYNPSKDIFDSKAPKTIIRFLRNNPYIKTIYLHFDNDNAGRLATKAIEKCFSSMYEIVNSPPKSGKDYNDYLCKILKINQKFKEKDCR